MTTTKPKKVPHTIWTNPIHFVACGFGIGALPFMPGTYGTLAAIPFYLIFAKLSLIPYIILVAVLSIIAVIITDITNRDFKTDDHPAAVSDEMIGFWVTMIGLPATWPYIVMGFLLFRLFDIWKPFPIGWIDKNIHGGIGVVLDDVVAALVSCGILHIIHFWLH